MIISLQTVGAYGRFSQNNREVDIMLLPGFQKPAFNNLMKSSRPELSKIKRKGLKRAGGTHNTDKSKKSLDILE